MRSMLSRVAFNRGVSVAALALLAACGGGDGGGTPSAEAPPAATGATAQGASTSTQTINLQLSGAKEVPPNDSAATGTGVVTIDPVSRQFTATVTTTGIAGTAAHIHEGIATDTGPVVFPMTEVPRGSGIWRVAGQLSEAQLIALLAERYYINVHSARFPGGEIRGQIPEE